MNDKVELKVELPNVINKTLEKPATTLGEKLSDLLEIIFGGITYKKREMEYKRESNFEKFKQELSSKVNAIPTENRVEPVESLVGPALESLKYRIDNNELRKMFATLIATSLDKQTVGTVHPAFVEVLRNLSSEDAKALSQFAKLKDTYLIPIISVDKKVMSVPNNVNNYCFLAEQFGFEKSNVILDSLVRNSLIEINYVFDKNDNFQGFTFTEMEAKFSTLREKKHVGRNVGNQLVYHYGTINLTAFGYDFASSCCD